MFVMFSKVNLVPLLATLILYKLTKASHMIITPLRLVKESKMKIALVAVVLDEE